MKSLLIYLSVFAACLLMAQNANAQDQDTDPCDIAIGADLVGVKLFVTEQGTCPTDTSLLNYQYTVRMTNNSDRDVKVYFHVMDRAGKLVEKYSSRKIIPGKIYDYDNVKNCIGKLDKIEYDATDYACQASDVEYSHPGIITHNPKTAIPTSENAKVATKIKFVQGQQYSKGPSAVKPANSSAAQANVATTDTTAAQASDKDLDKSIKDLKAELKAKKKEKRQQKHGKGAKLKKMKEAGVEVKNGALKAKEKKDKVNKGIDKTQKIENQTKKEVQDVKDMPGKIKKLIP